MADTGEKSPASSQSVDRVSLDATWNRQSDAYTEDGTNWADCVAVLSAGSKYGEWSNYSFSVPTGATINGILVRVVAAETSSGNETLYARLVDGNGTMAGDTKSLSVSGVAFANYNYGGATDDWNAGLDDADINDTQFGVRIWYQSAHTVGVDFIGITVYYTDAAGNENALFLHQF